MPTTKTAVITIYEAYRAPDYGTGMRGTIFPNMMMQCTDPTRRAEIIFWTLDELRFKVEQFYANSKFAGKSVAISVNMKRGERKPPGFDRAFREPLEFNLTLEPEKATK